MTDRDRLIELISQKQYCGVTYAESQMDDRMAYDEHTPNSVVADYLLANGVFILPEDLRGTEDFSISAFIEAMQMYKEKDRYIKPPCKVGQTVYYISFGKVYKGKCHAITKHKHGLQIHLYYYDGDNAKYPAKTVFLTKEEAEEKLKELNDNA